MLRRNQISPTLNYMIKILLNKHLITSLLIFSLSSCAYFKGSLKSKETAAKKTETTQNKSQPQTAPDPNPLLDRVVLYLPIDHSVAEKISLIVVSPKNFRCLPTNQDCTKYPVTLVAKNEDSLDRSRMIYADVNLNVKANAKEIFKDISKTFLGARKNDNAKVLSEELYAKDEFSNYTTIIVYSAKGKAELAYITFFCGPYDCSSVNYTITLDRDFGLEQGLREIKRFRNENLGVAMGKNISNGVELSYGVK